MGFSSNYFLYWSNLNEVITPFIAFICECSIYYQLFCVCLITHFQCMFQNIGVLFILYFQYLTLTLPGMKRVLNKYLLIEWTSEYCDVTLSNSPSVACHHLKDNMKLVGSRALHARKCKWKINLGGCKQPRFGERGGFCYCKIWRFLLPRNLAEAQWCSVCNDMHIQNNGPVDKIPKKMSSIDINYYIVLSYLTEQNFCSLSSASNVGYFAETPSVLGSFSAHDGNLTLT